MKIILDESAPQKLRLLIDNRHTVVTTWFQGWSGLKNGALLAAAEEAGFDLFITADQELNYQQNLEGRRMAILVLRAPTTGEWSSSKSIKSPQVLKLLLPGASPLSKLVRAAGKGPSRCCGSPLNFTLVEADKLSIVKPEQFPYAESVSNHSKVCKKLRAVH